MRVLALTGGVGGAKLCLGLASELNAQEAVFLVNTGDDFDHLGLRICPDIDTLTYTLSGEANPDVGWGRRDESWQFMAAMRELGGESWFNLGDRDLALHVVRTQQLLAGETLSAVTRRIQESLGIEHTCLPMSDQSVATVVRTEQEELAFQHYFVRDRCEPAVTGFRFAGIETATVNPALTEWLTQGTVDAVVICPSNPFVSVAPILEVPGMRTALRATGAPVIAVTPIIAGLAVKGPTAKMMEELAIPNRAAAVANWYGDFIDAFVLDSTDAEQREEIEAQGHSVLVTNTLMNDLADKQRLAAETLAFAAGLART